MTSRKKQELATRAAVTTVLFFAAMTAIGVAACDGGENREEPPAEAASANDRTHGRDRGVGMALLVRAARERRGPTRARARAHACAGAMGDAERRPRAVGTGRTKAR